jgi:hypothetical protein
VSSLVFAVRDDRDDAIVAVFTDRTSAILFAAPFGYSVDSIALNVDPDVEWPADQLFWSASWSPGAVLYLTQGQWGPEFAKYPEERTGVNGKMWWASFWAPDRERAWARAEELRRQAVIGDVASAAYIGRKK